MPTNKKTYLWKFLLDGMTSSRGNCVWKIGEWKKEEKAVKCSKGFHGSKKILDAFSYVPGSVLAKVEVRGLCDKEGDKQAWTEMRLVKAYRWKKEDSVKLAIYAAELVLDIFEKENPNDDRPRKAIEAAKEYLKNPGKDAAYVAANAAYAANAENAANAAACAAADAAYAADSAARAADSAAYAARAAYAAARAADAKKINAKIEKWLAAHVKELEEITE